METAKRFTELAAVASNRSREEGLYEQVAALVLLASFGLDEPHLRAGARAVLKQVSEVGQAHAASGQLKLSNAASNELKRLPTHDKRVRWWRKSGQEPTRRA